jgi:DNA-directed RNA polymerase subunit RPC12/RpoP
VTNNEDMCRYATTNYKPHYACFNCRKTYKRRLLKDIEGKEGSESKEANCPECGQLMASMGRDFEAPQKNDIKGWDHIKRLYSVGITFYCCGCTGRGYIPRTKDGIVAYLQDLIESFQYHLNFWRQREEPTDESEIEKDKNKNWDFITKVPYEKRQKNDVVSNDEARNYWISRIKEIEQKLIDLR